MKNNYIRLIEHLKLDKYERIQMCLDGSNEITTFKNLCKECTGDIISIRCPSRHLITLSGKQHLDNIYDMNTIHKIRITIADKNNEELSPDTRIRITKEKVDDSVTNVDNIFYKDISIIDWQKKLPHKTKSDKEWYSLNEGVCLKSTDILKFYVINSDKDIDCNNTKFAMDIDLWENTKL